MSAQDLITSLTEHGFSLNESRAYVALHQGGPSTGYEVGQRAQIPRSAVYGALRRLVGAGAARSIPGTPERFVATPAEALIALLRERFATSVTKLEEAVESLDVAPTVPDAFSVHGYERVLEEARRLVDTAEDRLVISGWPRELAELAPTLEAAGRRSVQAWVFSHAAIEASLVGVHFSYGLEERDVESFWNHRLVIVADDSRTLIGATEGGDSDNAVISETAAIAELATSQIALDLTLLAQRGAYDTTALMAELLGDRVGRLDSLLTADAELIIERVVRPRRKGSRRRKTG